MGKKAAYFFAIVFIILVAVAIYLINPFANKIKSGLQVVISDASASLFLNDQYLDKTPYINKKIQPGQYTLRIVPDDQSLAAYETQINLRKGLLTIVIWKPGPTSETSGGAIYELEPLSSKNQTEISFVSQPDGAIIILDDQKQEFAPIVIRDVAPGLHRFEASLPSFEIQQDTVNAVVGHRLNITLKLGKISPAQLDQPESTSSQPNGTEASDSAEANANDIESAAEGESDNSARTQAIDDQINGDDGSTQLVKIKKTNYFQEGIEVLRVRDAASVSGNSIGFVESNQTYEYLGQTENNWLQIKFKDALDEENKTGWVSNQYAELLVNENTLLDEL
jgi:SH3 domain-containing protein